MDRTTGLSSRRSQWTERFGRATDGTATSAKLPVAPDVAAPRPARVSAVFERASTPPSVALSGRSAREAHVVGADPLTAGQGANAAGERLAEVARTLQRAPAEALELISGGATAVGTLTPRQFHDVSSALFLAGATIQENATPELTLPRGTDAAATLHVARWLAAQLPRSEREAVLTDLRASWLKLQRDLEGTEFLRFV